MGKVYCLYDKELIDVLGLKDDFKISQSCFPIRLREYTTFRSLDIGDINNLRLHLFLEKEINDVWSEKILKYAEIWLTQLDQRLKLNYDSKRDRKLFKQYMVSFLLEACYYSKDLRFLNVAIKINGTSISLRKNQSRYNAQLINYMLTNL
ncbi:hypothetical protein OAI64_02515 [Schleiferiaceae bacterium]|nr:hypothetical protein [Schleiferiaceae bacterium]